MNAIVLDTRDYGESDKIVTFYSLDRGKITGLAKGANKSKKRFLNKLELFSHLSIEYKEKFNQSLIFINEAELISSFINIRQNSRCYICASYIRELLLITSIEQQSDQEIFQLFHWALSMLNSGKSELATCVFFQIRLFDRLGYCPDFSGCRGCGMALEEKSEFLFQHRIGGLLCSNCSDTVSGSSQRISVGVIRMLQAALTEPLERLHRFQFNKQTLQQSLILLEKYGRNLFQREFQSWKGIKEIL